MGIVIISIWNFISHFTGSTIATKYRKWVGDFVECVGYRAPIKFVCKKML